MKVSGSLQEQIALYFVVRLLWTILRNGRTFSIFLNLICICCDQFGLFCSYQQNLWYQTGSLFHFEPWFFIHLFHNSYWWFCFCLSRIFWSAQNLDLLTFYVLSIFGSCWSFSLLSHFICQVKYQWYFFCPALKYFQQA